MREYFKALWLLLELIGMHPRLDSNMELAETLRRWNWRPFRIERAVR